MLKDYRDWLISELKLLGNASHHAYSFGQANMAQRAIERLDEVLATTLFVELSKTDAAVALARLSGVVGTETLHKALATAVAKAEVRLAPHEGEPQL